MRLSKRQGKILRKNNKHKNNEQKKNKIVLIDSFNLQLKKSK